MKHILQCYVSALQQSFLSHPNYLQQRFHQEFQSPIRLFLLKGIGKETSKREATYVCFLFSNTLLIPTQNAKPSFGLGFVFGRRMVLCPSWFLIFGLLCAPIRIFKTSHRGWSTSQNHVQNPLNPRGTFFVRLAVLFLVRSIPSF